MSLADVFIAAELFKLAYNEEFEHPYILQAIIAKYPKVLSWAQLMRSYFGQFLTTYNSDLKPKPRGMP